MALNSYNPFRYLWEAKDLILMHFQIKNYVWPSNSSLDARFLWNLCGCLDTEITNVPLPKGFSPTWHSANELVLVAWKILIYRTWLKMGDINRKLRKGLGEYLTFYCLATFTCLIQLFLMNHKRGMWMQYRKKWMKIHPAKITREN